MTTRKYRKWGRPALGCFIAAFMLLCAARAYAVGTAAGTSITNSVTVDYTMDSTNHTAGASNTFQVNALLGSSVTWQDGAPVSVAPGQTGQVLTMRLSNIGNVTDTYTLSAISTMLTGTDFTPTGITLYLDSNGNQVYNAGTDQLYVSGSNDPSVAADGSLTVFILSTIPGTGVASGQKGYVQLTATSKTGTGSPGLVVVGAGPAGTDVIVGLNGGIASDIGSYIATSGFAVNVSKAQSVLDQYGGTQAITGATIRYTLTVTATGSGSASNVVVADPVPSGTTYTGGTLRLNGTTVTDAVDGDAGDVGGTTAGTVTIVFPGTITNATAAQTITFDVTIN